MGQGRVGWTLCMFTSMSVSAGQRVVQRLFLLVGGRTPEVYRIGVRGHQVVSLTSVLPGPRFPHLSLEVLLFNQNCVFLPIIYSINCLLWTQFLNIWLHCLPKTIRVRCLKTAIKADYACMSIILLPQSNDFNNLIKLLYFQKYTKA